MKFFPLKFSIFSIWCFSLCCSTEGQTASSSQNPIRHVQLTDSLYGSPQNINLLYISRESLSHLQIYFAYEHGGLSPTSHLALEHGGLAAINGSFFDMDAGGSVSYFELKDSIISKPRAPGLKWAVADSILNATLLLHRDSGLIIETRRPWKYYAKSTAEEFVMVSGPLLIKDSSLCSVISVVELTKSARNVVSANFRVFEVWFTVAFLYFAIILPVSLIVRRMERRRELD